MNIELNERIELNKNGFCNDDLYLSLIESFMFTFSDAIEIEDLLRFFLANGIKLDIAHVKDLLTALSQKYQGKNSGLELISLGGKYQIVTKKQNYEYLKKVLEPVKKKNLTQSAVETLAVIAYNQPATKSDIEKIKGVNCDYAVSKLIEAGMIEECGRLDTIGRPAVYRTTHLFLKYMGIDSIDRLPKLNQGATDVSEEF